MLSYYIIVYHISLYHMKSYEIISYHVISCYIMLYYIEFYYIILYHILSYYIIIISYYIILYFNTDMLYMYILYNNKTYMKCKGRNSSKSHAGVYLHFSMWMSKLRKERKFSLKRHFVLRRCCAMVTSVWGRVFPPRNDDLALPFPPGTIHQQMEIRDGIGARQRPRKPHRKRQCVCAVYQAVAAPNFRKNPFLKTNLGPETRPALCPKRKERIIFQPSIFRGENVSFTVDFLKTNRYLRCDWKMMMKFPFKWEGGQNLLVFRDGFILAKGISTMRNCSFFSRVVFCPSVFQ